MNACDGCGRAVVSDSMRALPCGRTSPVHVADQLMQLGLCRQKMVDAVQAGRDDRAGEVGRVVFRIAANLPLGTR